jgi:hypothetical protein
VSRAGERERSGVLETLRRPSLRELIVALSSVVATIVVERLLEIRAEDAFSSTEGAIKWGFITVIGLIGLLIVSLGWFERRRDADTAAIEALLGRLNQQLNIQVQFVKERQNAGTGETYARNKKIIESARERVWVLHYANEVPEMGRPGTGTKPNDRHKERQREYDAALLAVARKHHAKQDFYTRIIQSPEGAAGPIDEQLIGRRWMDHCRAMIDLQRESNHRHSIRLMKAPYFLKNTIILVDLEYVIFVLDAYEPDEQLNFEQGLLILQDRTERRELASFVEDLFQRVISAGRELTSAGDLEGSPGP